MPISAPDLAELTKVSLDEYMRNIPVDQIGTEHPFLKKLMSKRKLFLGARQNIVVNVRKSYDSNFAWAFDMDPVGYNKRNTTEPAAFPWRRAVDGLYLSYDRLYGNGIKVREGARGAYRLEQNEKVQLVNLLDEQMEVLKLGFLERLNLELLRNGTQSADAVTGLDGLVSLDPTTGTVGGIDRATATWWRNNVQTGIVSTTANTLRQAMERAWRRSIRTGGVPDFILAGTDFVDAYATYAISMVQNTDAGSVKRIDAATGSGADTGLYFKGVPIIWDPTFQTLDDLDAPVIPWEKRAYFLNFKHIEYRDDDMDVVTPVRPHDVLALYAMINLRLALVIKKLNAQAVLAIA